MHGLYESEDTFEDPEPLRGIAKSAYTSICTIDITY